MKDALGHGSNGVGGSSIGVRSGSAFRGIMPSRPFREGQSAPAPAGQVPFHYHGAMDGAAAASLASGPKSAPAPLHDAWSETPGGDREPSPSVFGNGPSHADDPKLG